jgi:hypothetical protein
VFEGVARISPVRDKRCVFCVLAGEREKKSLFIFEILAGKGV